MRVKISNWHCSYTHSRLSLGVYDGVDCGNLILLGCNDDTQEYECGSEAGGWHSHVVVPVTKGSGYLIRVGGWTEGSVGTAQLLIDLN
ncbi:MAG: hypothetical protein HOI88_05540 [Phycisphaerae bacterium]|nr:hypothetical protein [Phycisphaerae bacterium]